jgi:hypothetical protein
MFIQKGNRLYCVTDKSRFDFKTTLSKALLNEVKILAKKYNTSPNYLIETGLEKVIANGFVEFNKKNRPNDRVYYKSSYDIELIQQVKVLAEKHNLKYNDVMEYSFQFIEPEKAKSKNFRNRIE